ncbi:MAG: hypothetical protein ABUL71_01320, partial [Gemmatimonadota bacterium]
MRTTLMRSSLSSFVVAGALAVAPLMLSAQATTGFPNNPFPGTGNPFTLTWGADDGAACTQVGGPIDNGNTNAEIKGVTCAAARFDYYSNGWAQLSIWNRSGAEAGSSSLSTLRSFGLFWCQGVKPASPIGCPGGGDPLVGGTPPITYNDGTLAGNWYPGGASGNDPIDWRLISPTGQILVPPNSPNYPITATAANGIGGTKGDGCVDNGFSALPSTTPFTS